MDKVEPPVLPTAEILEFPGLPYRVVPEVVIRTLLSYLDKVEDIVVVFRLRGEKGLLMNYSSDIGATDLLVGSATIRSLAEQRMGIVAPTHLPNIHRGPEEIE